jgi:hypothetical protein
MHAFLRRFLMHYGIYRRYPLGGFPPCVMRGVPLSPDAHHRPGSLGHGGCAEDAVMMNFAAAMAILDQRMDLAGDEVDAGRKLVLDVSIPERVMSR